MSEQTKAVMDDAIRAHFADECDAHLTEYVLQAAGVLSDPTQEKSRYLRSTAPFQPFHYTLGLVEFLASTVQQDLAYDEDAAGDSED